MKNIIETAVANPDFSTLVTAIKEAGLVEALSAAGPFTVFAPTNEAFEKISKGALQDLLADKKRLTSVLKYHVVSGKVMSQDVAKITEAETQEGSKVKINSRAGVMINNSKVIKADIECSNGVIHVIDTILMP